MTKKFYAEALIEALTETMEEDPGFAMIGRGILGHGAHAHFDAPLKERYGDRITDPPTSEGAVTSMAVGAAMAGTRMFHHLGTGSFSLEAVNQLVNEAGVAHSMSGGQIKVPVVFHMYHGLRRGGSGQHSCSPQSMYANNPGLQLIMPTTPRDVKGLLRAALKGDSPTLFIDHSNLLGTEGEVPDEPYEIALGQADIRRAGSDVTIVATSRAVLWAVEAAERLAAEGIDAEVVDPRTIVPLDAETIVASIRKTGRLVCVEEGYQMCSIGSEIAALAAERAMDALKASVGRVARPPVPVPFSPPLEEAMMPGPDRIVAAVKATLA
jgi:pyruvate/2-oxoglutarate/acetoin dehydrogenase E1 component